MIYERILCYIKGHIEPKPGHKFDIYECECCDDRSEVYVCKRCNIPVVYRHYTSLKLVKREISNSPESNDL